MAHTRSFDSRNERSGLMPYVHQSLLGDGSLVLSIDESLRDLAAQWMPTLPEEHSVSHAPNASIRIDHRILELPQQNAPPILSLGAVSAWLDSSSDVVWLQNSASNLKSRVDLSKRFAAIGVAESDGVLPVDMTSL